MKYDLYRFTWRDWLSDWVWAWHMRRARAERRRRSFSSRLDFDTALRPITKHGDCIAYPDALYHANAEDIDRAKAS